MERDDNTRYTRRNVIRLGAAGLVAFFLYQLSKSSEVKEGKAENILLVPPTPYYLTEGLPPLLLSYKEDYFPIGLSQPTGGLIRAVASDPKRVAMRLLYLPQQILYSQYLSSFSSPEFQGGINQIFADGRFSLYECNLPPPSKNISLPAKPLIRVAVVADPKTSLLLGYDQRYIAKLPSDILSSNDCIAAISIGATRMPFISYNPVRYDDSNLQPWLLDDPLWPRKYALCNYLNYENIEQKILEMIAKASELGEFRHSITCEIPTTPPLHYQPQYKVTGDSKAHTILGANSFNYFHDQTINCAGYVIAGDGRTRGIMISGPWWLNQPNNIWAGGLIYNIVRELFPGFFSFSVFSADTGGQSGFWYRKQCSDSWEFSHHDLPFGKLQHTTLFMLAFG